MKVFDAIRKVRPNRLYLFQDGPRNKEEKKQIVKIRKAVVQRIDWKYDMKFI